MPNHPDFWLPAQWPAAAHVHAGVTTRIGGFSKGAYASFNLAQHVEDDPHCVQQNRQRLREQLGLPSEPRWLTQVHSKIVIEASTVNDAPQADACYTDKPQVVCVVMTADCLPVLITDRTGKYIAAVHAGWRGLQQQIISATISRLPTHSSNLLAWLGPAIGPQAFEVGSDVYDAFSQLNTNYTRAFKQKDAKHWWMDVYAAARWELQQAGVTAIYGGEYCTWHDSARFYSYRRDKQTGRMASLIWYDERL